MAGKVALGCGLAVMFAITVAVLMRVLPGPHGPTDYLVIGSVATLACISVLFVVYLVSGQGGLFYRRRRDDVPRQ